MKIVERENSLGRIVFDVQPQTGCRGATFIDRADAELFVQAKEKRDDAQPDVVIGAEKPPGIDPSKPHNWKSTAIDCSGQ